MAKCAKPTKAELELLHVLWRIGPATAKQAHAELSKEREVPAANVLRLLQIMFAKGLLSRNESQRSHLYAPVHAQASLQTGLLGDFIQRAFEGSGKALVLAALRSKHVTAKERREIQALLNGEELP